MQGLVTARQGGENSDRIGGYQPTSGTRTMQEASKYRNASNWTYSSHAGICLQTQHWVQWCAHSRGGGVQPEKKSDLKTPEQDIQAGLSLPTMKVQRVPVVQNGTWGENLPVAAG